MCRYLHPNWSEVFRSQEAGDREDAVAVTEAVAIEGPESGTGIVSRVVGEAMAEVVGDEPPTSQASNHVNHTPEKAAEPRTDPIFITIDPHASAVVASENKSFNMTKPKVNSNIRELVPKSRE